MAPFRGRGRGRGFGGFQHARPQPFELFPEIGELGSAKGVKQDMLFARRYMLLENDWSTSPFFIGDESESSKRSRRREIERFSDRKVGKTRVKERLSDYVRMDPDYVPAELAKGERKKRLGVKRVRWNPDSDLQKLDIFEKLEHKRQGNEDDEKKDGEEEEEDETIEEDQDEDSDGGDYEQKLHDFDDDEDDYNDVEDGDDEPTY